MNNSDEDTSTSDSYSTDLFNVYPPEPSAINRSEENEQTSNASIFSRVYRNLSALYSFIRAPVESLGQGVLFVIRFILTICGVPFTLLFNMCSAITRRMFPQTNFIPNSYTEKILTCTLLCNCCNFFLPCIDNCTYNILRHEKI